ncbi:bifunctional riboflavin kinase/FAD synthetase [Verticiella sediminum]
MNSSATSLRVFRGMPPAGATAPRALTIGNFDGVHLGHQAMLARVCTAAEQRGLVPTVMTFEPHPREFFAHTFDKPELAPARISGLRDKLAALAACGIQQVVVERFDARLAAMPPETFIERLLVAGLDVRWLLVGDDFRFGAKRTGDVQLLRAHGGFEVDSMDSITDRDGVRISSTDVRAALAAGDLERVADLLGRNYHMSGHVVHGLKLGRQLGFPTLNINVAPQITGLSGIFAVRVHGIGARPKAGVASLGVRPTVTNSGRVLLEVHLFDFTGDAYGKLARVEFLKKLREEAKFADLATLTAAIAQDVRQARAYFASGHPALSDLATSATDRI